MKHVLLPIFVESLWSFFFQTLLELIKILLNFPRIKILPSFPGLHHISALLLRGVSFFNLLSMSPSLWILHYGVLHHMSHDFKFFVSLNFISLYLLSLLMIPQCYNRY